MNGRDCRILLVSAALSVIPAACGGDSSEGTLVTLHNDRGSMIRSVELAVGGDTLRADTLQHGEGASWTLRTAPDAFVVLSWVEGTSSRSFSPVLLDSAFAAEEIRFRLLSGELDLEAAYHF